MRRDRLVYCIVLNLKGGVSFLEMFGGGGGGGVLKECHFVKPQGRLV